MNAHKTSNELLVLIGLIAFIFLLAALGLFMLSSPGRSLLPEASSSPGQMAFTRTITPDDTGRTLTNTPRTSYTPFATRLTVIPEAPTQAPPIPGTPTITFTPVSATPTATTDPYPLPATQTLNATFTPTSANSTPSATPVYTLTPGPSPTLAPGQTGISGRVVQNNAPLAGVVVSFRDDQPTRTAVTDAQGRYWFTTLAIGIDFVLTFEQSTNPQLASSTQIASTALIYGYLPTSGTVVNLPDLEISVVLNGQTFEPTSPVDGAVFSAANLTTIQLVWTAYPQVEYYYAELSRIDTDELLWGSENTTSTTVMFDGNLDDGTKITAGSYYWVVAANRPSGDYYLTIYSQLRDIVINP
ncbi:MAG TPA: carboxypeptidase regulatory-like domain-containing protein [Anaerolineales bacterium]|nr:carboxypeptidase regulatory-like domain-containing protein [Anaerolineales bacterium]